ncbi:DNA polymerase III epsilon subunit [Candidatus Rickettsiella viridis]|uniref:DNA polymerase III subunit epsilon n=1 Tax=Candidatus Rickettsiella viridis TaxID=676208 RepID=A0A2Z5UX38_9COXI|nr:DNA polymerase III subunit epsilon [Candidatus Rickettsiella viridis]BBB15705.1 DNA polymerase III epsilon subunit [Candidatus Rickettsiella viridis]
MRQIILDTETTGREISAGHRVIEIGCLELIDRRLTKRHFHCYLNPGRDSEAGALAVHGLTSEFLQDKPLFSSIVDELLEFLNGAELIIHNAPFDLAFLDNEIQLTKKNYKKVTHYCQVLDTLPLARQLHPGQRNSLDALCKRYEIDNSKRDKHGALLDAELLARVYLAMTGGQTNLFDDNAVINHSLISTENKKSITMHELPVLYANTEELNAHNRCLSTIHKTTGRCLWSNSDSKDIH